MGKKLYIYTQHGYIKWKRNIDGTDKTGLSVMSIAKKKI